VIADAVMQSSPVIADGATPDVVISNAAVTDN
jgi:hypothetical protein